MMLVPIWLVITLGVLSILCLISLYYVWEAHTSIGNLSDRITDTKCKSRTELWKVKEDLKLLLEHLDVHIEVVPESRKVSGKDISKDNS